MVATSVIGVLALVVSACGGGGATPTPLPPPTLSPTATPTAAPTPTPEPGVPTATARPPATATAVPTPTNTPVPTPSSELDQFRLRFTSVYTDDTADGVFGGTFRTTGPQAPPHFDPSFSDSGAMGEVTNPTHNQMVETAAEKDFFDVSYRPALAESWELTEGGKVWTFKMRQGVRFHNVEPLNGRAFTASDVVWTIERYKRDDGVRQARFSNVESVVAVDDATVVFNLVEPTPWLLSVLASPYTVMGAREVEEQFGDLRDHSIGTGPFILESFSEVTYDFVANLDYFQGRPFLDAYRYIIIRDEQTSLAAFRSGQSDMPTIGVTLTLRKLKDLLGSVPNLKGMISQALTVGSPIFVVRHDVDPFGDIRVRRALSMAINRESMNETLRDGLGGFVTGIPWPLVFDDPPTLEDLGPWMQYNPEKAKELLADAGFPDGFEIKSKLQYSSLVPGWEEMLLLMQEDLEEIGVKIGVQVIDYNAWAKAGYTRTYDAMFWGFQRSAPPIVDAIWDWANTWMHSASANEQARHSDEVMNGLIDELGQTFDEPRQRELIKEIWDRDLDQVQRIYLVGSEPTFSVWQPEVFNVRLVSGTVHIKWPNVIRQIWIDRS